METITIGAWCCLIILYTSYVKKAIGNSSHVLKPKPAENLKWTCQPSISRTVRYQF